MKTQATLHCYGFADHDTVIIKSLLQTFGNMPRSQWHYVDHDAADIVLVDCDNPQAVWDVTEGRLEGLFLVACSTRGVRCPGSRHRLGKPVRHRDLVELLGSFDGAGQATGSRPPATGAQPDDDGIPLLT